MKTNTLLKRKRGVISVLAAALIFSTAIPSWSQTTDDNYAPVVNITNRLLLDLDIIRRYFGKPVTELRTFDANQASGRHAFLLAQSIHRKLNLLSQEVAGLAAQATPIAPDRDIVATDVVKVLERAYGHVINIQNEYDLTAAIEPSKNVEQATSTEAVEEMISVLRQINLLLLKQYRPEDVYERLDLATVYIAGVLSKHGKTMYPDIPFVPNKQPIDVFKLLLDCAELSHEIAERTGVDALEINTRRMRNSSTRLSNNYDLATMMLSDVSVWTEALEGAEDIYPQEVSIKYTTPSHVFQKLSQLHEQMRLVLETLN